MFWWRTLSFVIIIPLFLLSVLWKSDYASLIFMAFSIFLAYNAVREFLSMVGSKLKKESYSFFTAIIGCLIVILTILVKWPYVQIPVILLYIITMWIVLLLSKNKVNSLEKIIVSSSAVFLIILPLNFIPIIYVMKDGGYLLLFLVLATKSGDTGAYIIGTLSNKLMPWGNHKIIPSISPKKSWEGTLGGLACSIIASLLLWSLAFDSYSFFAALFVGILLFFGGFVGDLIESSLKRACGAKDSGKIIPGMGGALDIIDSLIINAPIFYYFLSVFYLGFAV